MPVLERLGATDLASLIRLFRDALVDHKEVINQLNVYPVPDGDTGTNMSLTLESVVQELGDDSDDLVAVCKAISHGSLMGARGNSGVIMSQVLRGLADTLSSADASDAALWAKALRVASDAAYGAVMKPVEGTILTVVREVAEEAEAAVADGLTLLPLVERIRVRGYDALERTPDLLPVLADAGVVDAGGQGFLLLLDALLSVLDGRALPESGPVVTVDLVGLAAGQSGDRADGADRDDSVVDVADLRYEVMYFLDAVDERIDEFRNSWAAIGDSIVVVGGDGIWNCHVHTNDIGAAMQAGIDVGRPHQIRVTDLFEEVEHRETLTADGAVSAPTGDDSAVVVHSTQPARCAAVAVGVGDGVRRIFESLGAQAIVMGGQSMNPSTQLLLQAVEQVAADEVLLLPNNKNIIAVAEQVDATTDKTVRVVPTRGVAEGFASLMAYDPEASAADNAVAMAEAAAAVVAGEVTQAVRDSSSEVGPVRVGDFMGLSRDGIRAVSDTLLTAVTTLLDDLLQDDHELVTLITGADAPDATTAAVATWIETEWPDVELEVHQGGQPLYPYYVGIE